jgi:hypothetical protein
MIGFNFNPKAGGFLQMRKVCIFTVAVFLLGIGPLLAANNASLVGLAHPASVPNVAPDTVSEGFLATTVLLGITDPEGIVPCFNCVSGPDIQTLLIALPLAAVSEGQSVTVVITGDDLFYSGNADFTFNIKANPTVAPILTGTVSGDTYAGIWYAKFPITAPAPGEYILEGVISTGETLGQHTTVSTKIIIGKSSS